MSLLRTSNMRWISVEESLPENDRAVAVVTTMWKNSDRYLCQQDEKELIIVATFNRGSGWRSHLGHMERQVILWCPLPEYVSPIDIEHDP